MLLNKFVAAIFILYYESCDAYDSNRHSSGYPNTYSNNYPNNYPGYQNSFPDGYNENYHHSNVYEDQEHWNRVGREEIEWSLRRPINWNTAKNVIVFVAGGMDPNTITASRIYLENEKGKLSFEKFPHMGLLKTYSVNKKVPDEAASGTSLFTGVKTNNEVTGVDARVKPDDCLASSSPSSRLSSIMTWAQEAGKHTGFITNGRITGALASALYAHAPSRRIECIPPENSFCKDVASQLIEDEPGTNFRVILGGGRQCLMGDFPLNPVDNFDEHYCYRTDKKNLIEQWRNDKRMKNVKHRVVQTTGDLLDLDTGRTDYVLGVFANSYLSFKGERNASIQGQPSLEIMIEPAIKMLRKNYNGFVLMVESALIDKAHHLGYAKKAIDETIEFHNAVTKALDILNYLGILHETLLVVTGGHGHTMSINGYPNRTDSILGIAERSKIDGVSYTTLTYATGPKNNFQYTNTDGYLVTRDDPRYKDTASPNYSQQAAILTDQETHGGGDVTVYATGPMAHLFHTVHESSYVAHVIGYAAKIGPYRNAAIKTYPTIFILFNLILSIYKMI